DFWKNDRGILQENAAESKRPRRQGTRFLRRGRLRLPRNHLLRKIAPHAVAPAQRAGVGDFDKFVSKRERLDELGRIIRGRRGFASVERRQKQQRGERKENVF